MRLVRAWPRLPPLERPHVVDQLERVLTDGCEYSGLVGLGDVVVLDWDIVVDPDDLRGFAARCSDRVRVAPYRKYDATGWVWQHRRYTASGMRRITEGDVTCHWFGFGCVYLPGVLVDRFDSERVGVFEDAAFSEWHHRNVVEEVAVDWDCRTVHLNHPAVTL